MATLAAQAPGELDPEAGEFNLFLFMFLVIGIVALFVLALVGLIVGIVVATTGGFLVLSGAAFSSSLAAVLRKSPTVGFTLFVVQMAAVAGAILGGVTAALYDYYRSSLELNWNHIGLGCLAGGGASAALGWLSVRLWLGIWQQLQQWWRARQRVPQI